MTYTQRKLISYLASYFYLTSKHLRIKIIQNFLKFISSFKIMVCTKSAQLL